MQILLCVRVTAFGFCLAFASAIATGQSTSAPSEIIPALERSKAPNFTVTDVQGKPITLAALKGRVVLLDFWAIACGGCKLELPCTLASINNSRVRGFP